MACREMDEYRTQSDLNAFQEEKDSKTVHKKINIQNAGSSSDDTFVRASSSDDTFVRASSSDDTFVRASSSNDTIVRVIERTPRTECQLAAHNAEKMSEEARRISADGRTLLKKIISAVEYVQWDIRYYEGQADRGHNLVDFYRTMVDKYISSIGILEVKCEQFKLALDDVEETARQYLEFALHAEEMVDETLDESQRISRANHWTEKLKSAIIVAIKRERAALMEMKLIWINVILDTKREARALLQEERAIRTPEEDSDNNTPECANKDRITKIGHVVSTVLGISLLSVKSLFEVGSDSYYAILAFGLLTTGWSVAYWLYTFYKCLKSEDNEAKPFYVRDTFLEDFEENLERVRENICKYNISVQSHVESGTDFLEAIRVEI